MSKTPQAPSSLSRTIRELHILLDQISTDYRQAWDLSYVKLASVTPEIGKGHSYEEDGAPTNSLLVHAANEENRRRHLLHVSKTLDRALSDLRSARGIATLAKDPAERVKHKGQWSASDIENTEERYKDSKKAGRKP